MRAAGLRRTTILAADPSAPGTPGSLYTDDPLEVRTQQTRLDPGGDVVPALREAWAEIGEAGARTLAAQYSIESGAGRHCFNFNLGNRKATAREPHMYLRGVWEGLDRVDFERMRAASFGELTREEPSIDAQKKGHVVPVGKLVVVLDPPHPSARFRAYPSLAKGVEGFIELHKRIGAKIPAYLSALRAGDCHAVATILGSPKVRYYTGNVEAYAQGMINQRDIIIEGLGPIL